MAECFSQNEDCLFLHEPGCTDCGRCTYCGRQINVTTIARERPRLHNLNFDHILPQISGGRTVVPVCEECNKSKWATGLKSWLRWVRDNKPAKWDTIIECNKWQRHRVAEIVREVRDE